ncbi:iron ABC transporter permease [Maritimibacter sp. DP1N21-5]|uniref:FecCD family ABC transporter permease n=1 Tax=Maritimibacter sp. DP1N21-5 TaxID=2836867 RepID=UPI001C45E686|nr:iron ABC transporter permease [Maritimibacter sp. DP1N21-5]MBV7407699.1 iron ABC transporter permease [Maritimibacter sp. DP1N21-5]
MTTMADMTMDTPTDPGWRARRATVGLVVALFVAATASLFVGATGLSPLGLLHDLVTGQSLDLRAQVVILDIRLPRLVMGLLVGASLAVSGVIMQGLFRNPLADPGLVGVSAGAGLGAICAIVLGGLLPPAFIAISGFALVPLAAFAGSWLSVMALYAIATRGGHTSVATLLLAGIAIAALVGALSGVLIFMADDAQLRTLTFWGLGSLAGATWIKLAASAPLMLACLVAAPLLARGLNALTLGESAARHMGVGVEALKQAAIFIVAGGVGAAVAVSGGIGFVGLVVPHLLRLSTGPDHRYLLTNAALLGAITLVAADMVARSVVAPAELPIGIVMAIVGGPFFLWLLIRRRGLMEV